MKPRLCGQGRNVPTIGRGFSFSERSKSEIYAKHINEVSYLQADTRR